MREHATVERRFSLLEPLLDERMRRLIAAAEAQVLGYGGVSTVARQTGVSRRAIAVGINELNHAAPPPSSTARVRQLGGGRKKALQKDPTLQADLEKLIEPVTRGDPESPLRWTCKSLRKLGGELKAQGHTISYRVLGEVLEQIGYSLQANRKTNEGASHPDRNAQFEHMNRRVSEELAAGQPVISVDTKKKELVGDFKNSGRQYRPKGEPEKVRVHDFIIPELGRANPYGVYDIGKNLGWVNVGTDHDTSAFAVESIRRWWKSMGSLLYPEARRLLITADGGGSNGTRVRLWKVELQKLAEELGFPISVCHLPPATSKWNKIEHRLFCFITMNWRGQPLVSHEVIVQLIKSTTTAKGLKVDCQLDTNTYPSGQKVSDEELAQVNLQRDAFHGEWNYTISPRQQSLNL